jgi:hypothetical protein
MVCINTHVQSFTTINTLSYSSTLIEFLRNYPRTTPVLVLYYYFNFRDESTQTCENFVRSILQQLVQQLSEVPAQLKDLYMQHNSGSLRPSTKKLTACLISVAHELEYPVLLLGDAFDECSQWNPLWDFVSSIARSNCQNLHFLFTSRPEQCIGDCIGSLNIPSVSLVKCRGIASDIDSFIRESLWNSIRFSRISEEGKYKVHQSLTSRANGM